MRKSYSGAPDIGRRDGTGDASQNDGKKVMSDLSKLADSMRFIIENRDGDPITAEERKLIEGMMAPINSWIRYNQDRKAPLPEEKRIREE